MFNLFYKDLIEELSRQDGGIFIACMKLNGFCYADDILLSSTTVTELQGLIETAVVY